jgi:hypothetical protein
VPYIFCEPSACERESVAKWTTNRLGYHLSTELKIVELFDEPGVAGSSGKLKLLFRREAMERGDFPRTIVRNDAEYLL